MRNRPVIIAPSLLAADLLNLGIAVATAESAGADMHHIDVMDGHFVNNLSFGLPVIAALKRIASIPLDVHLMITNPAEMATKYVEAGANSVTFHLEAAQDVTAIIAQIKKAGGKAGVAVNPETEVSTVFPYLPILDMVTIMAVHPGFGGQKFQPQIVSKLEELRSELDDNGMDVAVDGGINADTARIAVTAGANVLVVGTYFYRAQNKKQTLEELKK